MANSLIFMRVIIPRKKKISKKIQKIEKLQLHMFATLISLIGCHFFLLGIDSWLRLRSCSTIKFPTDSPSFYAHWENDHPNRWFRETSWICTKWGGSHFDIPSGYSTVRHGKIHHV